MSNTATLKIQSAEEFTDYAKIMPIYGQGCTYPTGYGVDGFQVDYDVDITANDDTQSFHLVLQSLDRSNNMMGYNGVEMTSAGAYGVDNDETGKAFDFLTDADFDAEEVLKPIYDDAKARCKACYQANLAQLISPLYADCDDEQEEDLSLVPKIMAEFKKYDDLSTFTEADVKEVMLKECEAALKAEAFNEPPYSFSEYDNIDGFESLVQQGLVIVKAAKGE